MAKWSFRVSVNGAVLAWARKSIGYDIHDVAERLNVSEKLVQMWESGEKKPTIKELEKLAKMYKRPLMALLLPEPPPEPPMPRDFRTVQTEERKNLSQKTLLALRYARRLQTLMLDLSTVLEHELKPKIWRVSLSEDPEAVAMRARKELGVSIETQFGWKNEEEALEEWIKGVQDRGVLVSQQNMGEVEEVRAFSLTGAVPVIVLNNKDSTTAKIFSLFHEFCHLLLNMDGICDMECPEILTGDQQRIEWFCNHFAGAFLVPKDALLSHEIVKETKSEEWSQDVLKAIAKDFKVSPEVILRRLVIVGKVSPEFYSEMREFWKSLEAKTVKRGGRKPAKECIRKNSPVFVSYVLEAYDKDLISYHDVADYLSIRTKYIPEIRRLVRESA